MSIYYCPMCGNTQDNDDHPCVIVTIEEDDLKDELICELCFEELVNNVEDGRRGDFFKDGESVRDLLAAGKL